MKRFIPLALLAVAGTAVAQPAGRLFDLHGFDAVELASSDTIRIVPGSSFSVTADGDPRAVASLSIVASGGTVRVGRTPGRHDDRGAAVTIRMPMLRAITLSGSGAIEAGGAGRESLTARLSGSGQVRLPGLHARQVRLILDGSGSIATSGRAERVGIELGGSGQIEATALETPTLAVDLGGSGTVSATASSAASIKAGGSGSVRVTGHPTCAVTRSGAARVTCG